MSYQVRLVAVMVCSLVILLAGFALPVVADEPEVDRVSAVETRLDKAFQETYPDRPVPPVEVAMDQEEINAASYPDGRIVMNAGIVHAAKSDDELAAALAHEMTHWGEGHHRQIMKNALPWMIVGAAAGYYAGGKDAEDAVTGAEVGGALAAGHYSRDDEYRADAGAVRLLAKAGYDPYAVERLLTGLQKAYGNGYAKVPVIGWLSSHPDTGQRIKSAHNVAAGLSGNRGGGALGLVYTQPSNDEGEGTRPTRPAPEPTPSRSPQDSLFDERPDAFRMAVFVDWDPEGNYDGDRPTERAFWDKFETILNQRDKDHLVQVVEPDDWATAWKLQDAGKSGRFDPATTPRTGGTHAPNAMIVVSLNYWRVTRGRSGNVSTRNAGVAVDWAKVELKGNARLELVSTSAQKFSPQFSGVGTTQSADVVVAGRGGRVRGSEDRPLTDAALQRAAEDLANQVLGFLRAHSGEIEARRPTTPPAPATPQPVSPESVRPSAPPAPLVPKGRQPGEPRVIGNADSHEVRDWNISIMSDKRGDTRIHWAHASGVPIDEMAKARRIVFKDADGDQVAEVWVDQVDVTRCEVRAGLVWPAFGQLSQQMRGAARIKILPWE